jgi:ribosome maturation protein Sdo1
MTKQQESKYRQIGYLVTTREQKDKFDATLYPDAIRAAMERNGVKFKPVYVEDV